MTTRNFNQPYNPSQMVDKQIGDVYPNVRAVAQHLTYLVYLAENLEELRPLDIEIRSNYEKRIIEWRYVEEGAEWKELITFSSISGPSVEMQSANGFVQYRVEGTTEWKNVVPLSEISGKTAEMGENNNVIRWRLEGGSWIPLYDMNPIITTAQDAKTAANNAQAVSSSTASQLDSVKTRQDALEAGQSTSALYFATKSDMDAVTGTTNQGAFVTGGVGAGQYKWSGTAWVFLRGDTLAEKASIAQLNEVKDSRAESKLSYRRSTGKNFRHSVITPDGRVLLGIDRDFRTHVKSLAVSESTARHRSGGGYIFSLTDSNNKLLFGINKQGHADFKPSAKLIDKIADAIGTGSVPTMLGVTNPKDVRWSTDIVRGTTEQGGWYGDVQQPKNTSVYVAIASSLQPIVGINFYGQSNAGGGGEGVAVLKTPLYPHHAVTFSHDKQQYGTELANAADLTELKTLADDSLRPFAAVTSSFAMEAIARQNGESSPITFSRTDWEGSQPLTSFVRGTTNWKNLMLSIKQASTVCRRYGRDFQPHVVWVQGEAGPSGRENYRNQLNALIEDARSEVLAQNKKSLPWVIWQQSHYTVVDRGVHLALRDVARNRPCSNVVLAGATHYMPYSDGIHYDHIGRMLQGEMTALALRSIARTGSWKTLDVENIVRNGSIVVLNLNKQGGPIAFDTDWIEAVPNYGFSFKDSTGNIAISSVRITGDYQITIQLVSAPTGSNKLLCYGSVSNMPTDPKWTRHRGQVYSSSGEDSPFYAMGYAVPSKIRLYLPLFEESVE